MLVKFSPFCLAAAVLALLASTATSQCPPSWLHRGPSCYRWFPSPQYWFQAEQTCLSHQGHLVSVGSQAENTLVGRLANCSHAWIGRFGTDLNRLSDPTAYEWTDGSDPVRFERHNFSQLNSVHKPLIRTDGDRWLNSLYHERYPFLCKLASENSTERSCPSGWTHFHQHCYVLPHFEANFNEANFYCQRNASQLASVLTEPELTFIKRLSFGIDSCERPLDSVWLGLIKLNPCFPDAGGRELCYQWTDFSGKHDGFPRWLPGHPQTEDWTANCAALEGDGLRSDKCFNRRRFVCKRTASNDTDGQVDGVVAAFDFKKGLTNLVDPKTYVVHDVGIPRSAERGACFNYLNRSDPDNHRSFYTIGELLSRNESLLGLPEWTLFFRDFHMSGESFTIVSIGNHTLDPKITLNHAFRLGHQTVSSEDVKYLMNTVYYSSSAQHSRAHFFSQAPCQLNTWCDRSMTMTDMGVSNVTANDLSPDKSSYSRYDTTRRFDKVQIYLGFSPYREYCIGCFGIATKRLSTAELKKAFEVYCT